MQVTSSIHCHWSQPILIETGWNSAEDLIKYLNSVSEGRYSENNLPEKSFFIAAIRRLILGIEVDGDTVKEAKGMTAPGSILNSLSADYLFMRNRYLQKRKKLKEQLGLIKKMKSRL